MASEDDKESPQHADSRHSIMELEGLGKEIWNNLDAQQYVHDERAAWD